MYQQASRIGDPNTALVRNIPETFKGLGLSQPTAFCPHKAMLAGIKMLLGIIKTLNKPFDFFSYIH